MASPLNPNQFDPLGLHSPNVGAKPIQRGPVRYEDTVRGGGRSPAQTMASIDEVLAETSKPRRALQGTAFPGWEEGAEDFDRAESELADDYLSEWRTPEEVATRMETNRVNDMEDAIIRQRRYDPEDSDPPFRLFEAGSQSNSMKVPAGYASYTRDTGNLQAFKQNVRKSASTLRALEAGDTGGFDVFDVHPSSSSLNDLEALEWQQDTYGHADAPVVHGLDRSSASYDFSPHIDVKNTIESLYRDYHTDGLPLLTPDVVNTHPDAYPNEVAKLFQHLDARKQRRDYAANNPPVEDRFS